MIQRAEKRPREGAAIRAAAAIRRFTRMGYAKWYLFAALSQRIFFWFLNESVAMWPEIAASCPTFGGAIGFSFPWMDAMKFLK